MRVCFLIFFLILHSVSYAQKLDLIVTSDGTNIVCKIDSITDTKIYFQVKAYDGHWVQTKESMENIRSYQFECIESNQYSLINGTSVLDKKAKLSMPNRNAILVSGGTFIVYFSAVGFYERILSKTESNFLGSRSFVRLGFGGYTSWGDQGTFIVPQFGFLTGGEKSHIEMAAGFYLVDSDSDISFALPLSGVIAYRYQEADGNFIGRIGIGFPEAIFVSFGISF